MRLNLKKLLVLSAATASWMLVAVPAAQAAHDCVNIPAVYGPGTPAVYRTVPGPLISPARQELVSPAQPGALISPAVYRTIPAVYGPGTPAVYRTIPAVYGYGSITVTSCCMYTHTNRWRNRPSVTCVSYDGPITDCGEHGNGFLGHSSSGPRTYPEVVTYSYLISPARQELVSPAQPGSLISPARQELISPAVYGPGTPAVYRTIPAVYGPSTQELVSPAQPGPLIRAAETICTPHSSGGANTPATYTLTYIAGTGGSISGQTTQTVTSGSNGSSVTARAASGYEFVGWSDGRSSASRTETNVTASRTFVATFQAITPTKPVRPS